MNYIEEEDKYVLNNFNLNDILDFTKKNRVEIIIGTDHLYQCFINYKKGDGCYATSLTPLYALLIGIKQYNKNKP